MPLWLQYIQWAGAEGDDVFFTDPGTKQLFKDHIDAMVNRRNTINNRLYKDDPTIFAWDLMNEPRCDCFPDFIPVPDSYVSCRPECAKKVQVCYRVQWLCVIYCYQSCLERLVHCMQPFGQCNKCMCGVGFAAHHLAGSCVLVCTCLFCCHKNFASLSIASCVWLVLHVHVRGMLDIYA